MNLKHLIGLTCGIALLAPAGAFGGVAPTATITGPDTVTRGAQLNQFTANCSGCGGATLYYEWDRDGDGVFPDADKGLFRGSIWQTYDTLGQKTIAVKVRGHNWTGTSPTAEATATKVVTVVNAAPDVEFSCDPTRAETGEQVTCEIDVADDPDTDQPVALAWDVDGDGFDDGTGDEITFSYATEGEKTVRLRGTDADGGATVTDRGVDVWTPAAGQPFAMSAAEVTAGDEVTFTAPYEAGEQGDSVYERKWDFDGDGEWDDHGTDNRVVEQLFDEPGTYSVRLHVQAEGQPETATITTQQIVVKPEPVVVPPPKDEDKGGSNTNTNTNSNTGGGTTTGTGAGSSAGTGTPAPGTAAPAQLVTAPAPVAVARTIAPVVKKAAVKKAAAKKCRTVKGKRGKKTTKCAAAKKAKSRAKTRGAKKR